MDILRSTDPPYVDAWSERFTGELFVDVGAFVGSYTARLAKRFRKGIAFEPNPEFRMELERNLRVLGIANVEVRPEALYSSAGEAELFRHGPGRDSVYLNHPVNDHLSESSLTVELARLDDFRIKEKLGFLKVDVEGAELDVLAGARGVISRHRPKVQVESHREENNSRVTDFLRSFGYTVELITSCANQNWVLGYP
jgi:FkbM family methyltransferase